MITNYSYALFTIKDVIHFLQILFPIWVAGTLFFAFVIYWKNR